jgi:hypothetical protein
MGHAERQAVGVALGHWRRVGHARYMTEVGRLPHSARASSAHEFAPDSPLEEAGFEPLVPPLTLNATDALGSRTEIRCRRNSKSRSPRLRWGQAALNLTQAAARRWRYTGARGRLSSRLAARGATRRLSILLAQRFSAVDARSSTPPNGA